MQVHQIELEKERHMKDEKNSVVRPLYEVADSFNPDQILEIVNKSVRVRKSHLQDPSLKLTGHAAIRATARKIGSET